MFTEDQRFVHFIFNHKYFKNFITFVIINQNNYITRIITQTANDAKCFVEETSEYF